MPSVSYCFNASFSYEDEEGKIQSRLEEWWIRIDDFKRQALSSHVAAKSTASGGVGLEFVDI